GPEWQTGLWMLRSSYLFLAPGDSPVGFRLPLQSLAWEPAGQIRQVWTIDPLAPTDPLPVIVRRQRPDSAVAETDRKKPAMASQPVTRSALSVKQRGGNFCIFPPRVISDEYYVKLITAIEDTAAH